jgi:hypothetical protein
LNNGPIGYPATSITANLCCVTTQKSKDLIPKNAACERIDCINVKWRGFAHKTMNLLLLLLLPAM